MKQHIKTAIFQGLNCIFSHGIFLNKAVILMYHSVGNNGVFFTVDASEFQKQMDYLSENGYSVISLSELIKDLNNGTKVPKKCAVLTFDDGYQDNYENAFPILRKHGFPATIFVATGFIGKTMNNSYNEPLPMLTWDQIKEMHGSGIIEFEPHTASHKKLPGLSREEAVWEVGESKRRIEEQLKKKCRVFAYPYGSYEKRIQNILGNQGFCGAVTTSEGLVSRKKRQLFALPRNSIDSSVNLVGFRAKLSNSIVVYNLSKRCYVSPF